MILSSVWNSSKLLSHMYEHFSSETKFNEYQEQGSGKFIVNYDLSISNENPIDNEESNEKENSNPLNSRVMPTSNLTIEQSIDTSLIIDGRNRQENILSSESKTTNSISDHIHYQSVFNKTGTKSLITLLRCVEVHY